MQQSDSDFHVVVEIAGVDVDEPLDKFVGDFNSYLDTYNQSSLGQNRMQAGGYFVAFLTAVLSLVISL